MCSDKKILTLEEMRTIHTRLTSFILDKTTRFYESILRKMFAEVFSKSDIRYINNNTHKYGVLLCNNFYDNSILSIDYCNEKSSYYDVIIKKSKVKHLLPKNVALNISYIKIDKNTVKSKNLRKYYDALNMLSFSINSYKLNEFHILGWSNPFISKYYRKSAGYLKKHNALMYNILMNEPGCMLLPYFDMNKKDTMGIYEYYSKYFCGYTGQCISFLRYLKAFDGYIIKMILSMRSGEWHEKDNKK